MVLTQKWFSHFHWLKERLYLRGYPHSNRPLRFSEWSAAPSLSTSPPPPHLCLYPPVTLNYAVVLPSFAPVEKDFRHSFFLISFQKKWWFCQFFSKNPFLNSSPFLFPKVLRKVSFCLCCFRCQLGKQVLQLMFLSRWRLWRPNQTWRRRTWSWRWM